MSSQQFKQHLQDAFTAGGLRSSFHGRPGIPDSPDFEEWYKQNYPEKVEPSEHLLKMPIYFDEWCKKNPPENTVPIKQPLNIEDSNDQLSGSTFNIGELTSSGSNDMLMMEYFKIIPGTLTNEQHKVIEEMVKEIIALRRRIDFLEDQYDSIPYSE